MKGQCLNADTDALRERAKVNSQGAVHNLEDWIIEQVSPRPGMKVLDLGCGTGKQIFALAERVSPGGRIVGIDISEAAVNAVNVRAIEGKQFHVRAVQGSLDTCVELCNADRFDLVLSAYAIYYATDMLQLFCTLKSLLNPGGKVFVCGPGQGTNREIIELLNRLISNRSNSVPSIDDFIHESDLAILQRCYSKVNTIRLQNKIRFSTVEPLIQWWKNHSSFVPELEEALTTAVKSRLDHDKEFVLSKNVLGVLCYA